MAFNRQSYFDVSRDFLSGIAVAARNNPIIAGALAGAVALGVLACVGAVAVSGGSRSPGTTMTAKATPAARSIGPTTTSINRSMIPTTDEWMEKVRSHDFWNNMRRQNGGATSGRSRDLDQGRSSRLGAQLPWNSERFDDGGSPRKPATSNRGSDFDATYRTVCVRLCDGFYTPLSFSTSRDKLDDDAARCEASCSGQTRMFYYKNPGEEIEDMEDLDGKPYKKLATAFAYRTTYNAQCTCRPHPWQEEARDRHKFYALQAAGNNGDKAAKKDAVELSQRLKKAESEAAAARAEAEKAAKKPKAAETAKPGKSSALKDGAMRGVEASAGAELVGVGMTLAPATAKAGSGKSRMSRTTDRRALSLSPAAANTPRIWSVAPAPTIGGPTEAAGVARQPTMRSASALPRVTAYGIERTLTPVRN